MILVFSLTRLSPDSQVSSGSLTLQRSDHTQHVYLHTSHDVCFALVSCHNGFDPTDTSYLCIRGRLHPSIYVSEPACVPSGPEPQIQPVLYLGFGPECWAVLCMLQDQIGSCAVITCESH